MTNAKTDTDTEDGLQIALQRPKAPGVQLWYPSESKDFVMRWKSPSTPSIPAEKESKPDTGKEKNKKGPALNDTTKKPMPMDNEKEVSSSSLFLQSLPKGMSMDDEIDVSLDSNPIRARCLISYANKGQFIAASLRFSGDKGGSKHEIAPPIDKDFVYQISKPVDRETAKHVFSPDAVADCVLGELGLVSWKDGNKQPHAIGFHRSITKMPTVNGHPTGLIVVAGGTGTGKSVYARALILRWLIRVAMTQYKTNSKRLHEYDAPHLVTFEDPIEGWAYYSGKPNDLSRSDFKECNLCEAPESDLRLGIRLTARAKGKDVSTLKEAVLHALRQKPRVIYVGECREEDDWNQAIHLGATGHLVVTTCHSSTLVDTFMKLAGERKHSAQSRQQLAASLLGVLHLRTSEFKTPPNFGFSNFQTQFHLWKNTPESVSNFVMDGLSSIVSDGDNVISRMTMAKKILEIQKSGYFDNNPNPSIYENFEEQTLRSGFELDIRGQ
jgi:Tfp pilus assembly pilus retraction ATPase PilT